LEAAHKGARNREHAGLDSELFSIYRKIYLDRSEDLECLNVFEKYAANMGPAIAGIGMGVGGGMTTDEVAGKALAAEAVSGCLITAIYVS
jgi:hypothetical protein